jgi:hypothetical protein
VIRYNLTLSCLGPDAESLSRIVAMLLHQLQDAGYDVEEHRVFIASEPEPIREVQG